MPLRFRVTLASPESIRARSAGAIVRAAELDDPARFPGGRGAHLELPEPVLHPLLVADRPSPVALLLDLRGREIDRAARRGPEAARALGAIDLAALCEAPGAAIAEARTPGKRRRIARRIALARALRRGGVEPAWMAIEVLPVPAPEARAAWVDLDAHYRSVVSAAERLRVDRTDARYAALYDAVAALCEVRAAIARHLAARHAPVRGLASPAPVAGRIFSAVSSELRAPLPPEALFGLWYATRADATPRGDALVCTGIAEVIAAHAHGAVDLHDAITVRTDGIRSRTTVGRALLFDALEGRVPFARLNRTVDARAVRDIVEAAHRDGDVSAVVRGLHHFGLRFASISGFSLALDDFASPPEKAAIVAEAAACEAAAQRAYQSGEVTDGERYNRIVDGWAEARDGVAQAVRARVDRERGLGALQTAGVLERDGDLSACAGMIGLVPLPSGEILERPVVPSLADGLSPHDAFCCAMRARAQELGRRSRHREARLLFQRLEAAIGGLRIVTGDCGAREGVELAATLDAGRIVISLGRRALGRTVIDEVRDPHDGSVVVHAGDLIDERAAARLDRAMLDAITVRSPITCVADGGVCARCYGSDPRTRLPVPLGAKIGAGAAWAIGETVARLRPRVLAIGSAAGAWSADPPTGTSKRGGVARHERIDSVKEDTDFHVAPAMVLLGPVGRIAIIDDSGHEIEAFRVRHGDRVLVADGSRVEAGQAIVEQWPWDRQTLADIPEDAQARVSLAAIAPAKIEDRLEALTGLIRGVIIAAPASTEPALVLELGAGSRPITIRLRVGDRLIVNEGDMVRRGAVLIRSPREPIRIHDPWGGISALARILGAHRSMEDAIVSATAGTVSSVSRSLVRIEPDDGSLVRYQRIPRGRDRLVQPGDRVERGEVIVSGPTRHATTLALLGRHAAVAELLAALADVLADADEPIASIHLELVIAAMLSRVRVADVADTNLLPGRILTAADARAAIARAAAAGRRPPAFEPVLSGLDDLCRRL